jgi:4-hydroxy-tetrahydrodipicolinate synthase
MTTTGTRQPLQGIWLPLITPFRDGALDIATLAALVRHYGKGSIDGLILTATTGESLTLEPNELERLVEVAAEANAGRLSLYLGLCGSDTRRLALTLTATRAWPVEGYLITCPYYTRPSQEGLYRHFAALAEATDRPIILYNIPYRTGVNLANETLLRLAELRNIVGVKDCCATHSQTVELLRLRPKGFSVLTGEDALFLSAVAHGADGGILASAHVDPAAFAETRNAFIAGEVARAQALWRELSQMVALLFAAPSPAPVKYWLWRQGLIPSPELRLPMTEVTEGLAERIAQMIERRRVRGSEER